jgi:hypothetical protein
MTAIGGCRRRRVVQPSSERRALAPSRRRVPTRRRACRPRGRRDRSAARGRRRPWSPRPFRPIGPAYSKNSQACSRLSASDSRLPSCQCRASVTASSLRACQEVARRVSRVPRAQSIARAASGGSGSVDTTGRCRRCLWARSGRRAESRTLDRRPRADVLTKPGFVAIPVKLGSATCQSRDAACSRLHTCGTAGYAPTVVETGRGV